MKAQLFIIIAVLVSSLLTLSQRANASELRCLEPTVEQAFSEIVTTEKDQHSDNDYAIFITSVFINKHHRDSLSLVNLDSPIVNQIIETVLPRAPPVSLI